MFGGLNFETNENVNTDTIIVGYEYSIVRFSIMLWQIEPH